MERIADLVLRPLNQIDPDASFSDLGLDSKGVLSLVGDIEEQFLENPKVQFHLYGNILCFSTVESFISTESIKAKGVEPDVVTPKQEEGLMSKCEVAVVGAPGCRFPGADGPSEFWELLRVVQMQFIQLLEDAISC